MKHVIENFKPTDGMHCITHSLKQIFAYEGCPLSEAMLLGMGSSLAFTYINLANSPMVSGRTKSVEADKKLAERLKIKISCRQPKNYETGFLKVKKLIRQNHPVMIYVDMPYLSYLGMDQASHFGGHAVVLFGYDDEQEVFYVSDRDHSDYPIRTPKGESACDYHLVSYQEMKSARSSRHRPFPANNKFMAFDFSDYEEPNQATIIAAINDTCEAMLNPPAKLLGINGIIKFSKKIIKWRSFDQRKLKTAGITNYFQISQDGGTGGGIFRRLYGEFLLEEAPILADREVAVIGSAFINLSKQWDELAAVFWTLGENGDSSLLQPLSEQIAELGEIERDLLEKLQAEIID